MNRLTARTQLIVLDWLPARTKLIVLDRLPTLAQLCEVLSQRVEGRLGARQVSRLQRLPQLLKQLVHRAATSAAMVTMVAMGVGRLVLKGLLNLGEVLLRPSDVPRLQVLRPLVPGLGNRSIALRRRRCAGGSHLLQCDEVGLRRRQIARLQILAQLLKFFLKLLHLALDGLIRGLE